jgi:hypothetical protein
MIYAPKAFSGDALRLAGLTAERAADFWSKVDIGADDHCWPWMRSKSGSGCGAFYTGTKLEGAHRIAVLLPGKKISDGMVVRHTCDNPECCNFGLNWSLELYQQFNARVHRQGQQKPVIIHHLAVRDTVDQTVLSALRRKDMTQKALLNALKEDIVGRVRDG